MREEAERPEKNVSLPDFHGHREERIREKIYLRAEGTPGREKNGGGGFVSSGRP